MQFMITWFWNKGTWKSWSHSGVFWIERGRLLFVQVQQRQLVVTGSIFIIFSVKSKVMLGKGILKLGVNFQTDVINLSKEVSSGVQSNFMSTDFYAPAIKLGPHIVFPSYT